MGPAGFPGGSGVRACPWAGEHPPTPPLLTGMSHGPTTPPVCPADSPTPHKSAGGQPDTLRRLPDKAENWQREGGLGSLEPIQHFRPWDLTLLGLASGSWEVSLTEGSLCLSQGTPPVQTPQLSFLPPGRTPLLPIHPKTAAAQTFPEHPFYHVTPRLRPAGGSPAPVRESTNSFPQNS